MKLPTSSERSFTNSIVATLFLIFALVVLGGVGAVVFLSNINNNLRPAQQVPRSPEIPAAIPAEDAEDTIAEFEVPTSETDTEIIVKNIVPATLEVSPQQSSASSGEERKWTHDDAYIINIIRYLRVEAELSYDDNNRSYSNVCIDMAGYYGDVTEISMPNCDDSATQYAIDIALSTGEYYCIDSTGAARVVASSKGTTATVCPII